ncbi:hypothetical protein ACFWWC_19680 [Streptomyces sp. NPDC058642]
MARGVVGDRALTSTVLPLENPWRKSAGCWQLASRSDPAHRFA